VTGWASPWHIAIFAIVVILLFGAKRLPEIGRSLGTGMKEFKRSIAHDEEPPRQEITATATEVPVATRAGAGNRREHDSI
jgi:sec-independent protein translocase protein TatA